MGTFCQNRGLPIPQWDIFICSSQVSWIIVESVRRLYEPEDRDDDGETVFSGHKSAANTNSQQSLQHTQEWHEFKIDKTPNTEMEDEPRVPPLVKDLLGRGNFHFF